MTTPRRRTRPSEYLTITTRKRDGVVTSVKKINSFEEHFDDIASSSDKKSDKPCEHSRVIQAFTGTYYENSSQRYKLTNYHDAYLAKLIGSALFNQQLGAVHIPLAFEQNNGFEILTTLWEIDDLIKLFSPKYWGHLFKKKNVDATNSFGFAQWSLLPFFSDLSNLYSSLHDIQYAISDELANWNQGKPVYFKTELEIAGDFLPHAPSQKCAWSFEGIVTLKGRGRIDSSLFFNEMDAIAIFLDEIGFHPDLKTVWDLIPMSFVVDYFLPVGDSLDALHPRGWYNPSVEFTGTFSLNGYVKHKRPLATSINNLMGFSESKFYRRSLIDKLQLPTEPPPEINWNSPSIREIGNAGFLYLKNGANGKKPKKLYTAGDIILKNK
jgi:hypothetical protein